MLPQSITNAIESLSDLPGIGHRSAERLVFSLLKNKSNLDQKIAHSIGELKSSVGECASCFHYCDIIEEKSQNCTICRDYNRDKKTICVVETPIDLIALEKTHEYKGQYHVLHGIISPINKVLPEDLRIQSLLKRIQDNTDVTEIIFALAGNVESDATVNFIIDQLTPTFNGKITKLAQGIPSGGDLDYLDSRTIGRAILDRRNI